jgi:hypothetical protein
MAYEGPMWLCLSGRCAGGAYVVWYDVAPSLAHVTLYFWTRADAGRTEGGAVCTAAQTFQEPTDLKMLAVEGTYVATSSDVARLTNVAPPRKSPEKCKIFPCACARPGTEK